MADQIVAKPEDQTPEDQFAAAFESFDDPPALEADESDDGDKDALDGQAEADDDRGDDEGDGEGTSTADPETDGTAAPDLWTDAPDHLKAAHEAALRERELEKKRLSGTVSGLQKRLNELERQQRAAPAAPTAASPEGDDKATGNKPAAWKDRPEWKQLKADFGEVAAPLEQTLDSILSSVTEDNAALRQQLATLSDAEAGRHVETQVQSLQSAHSDWQDVTSSKDFYDWYTSQGAEVRAMVERNAEAIVDADSAAAAITLFKATTGRLAPPAAATPNEPPADAGSHNQRDGKRSRQLDSAAGPASRGPGVGSGPPDSFDGAWAFFDAKDERKGR